MALAGLAYGSSNHLTGRQGGLNDVLVRLLRGPQIQMGGDGRALSICHAGILRPRALPARLVCHQYATEPLPGPCCHPGGTPGRELAGDASVRLHEEVTARSLILNRAVSHSVRASKQAGFTGPARQTAAQATAAWLIGKRVSIAHGLRCFW